MEVLGVCVACLIAIIAPLVYEKRSKIMKSLIQLAKLTFTCILVVIKKKL